MKKNINKSIRCENHIDEHGKRVKNTIYTLNTTKVKNKKNYTLKKRNIKMSQICD